MTRLAEIPAIKDQVVDYLLQPEFKPLFLVGDSASVLRQFPESSVDFCMTSPPYWGHREYLGVGGIGLEKEWKDYLSQLVYICQQVHRVLKPSGSFWLNLGDTYQDKQLLGIPWRVALELVDKHGWILRNSIIWHKVKGGPDTAKDRLRNVHENLFHFVRSKDYFYDSDAVRKSPQTSKVVNGAVVSATGVRGVRYRRQIELSSLLSAEEKQAAISALEGALGEVQAGTLADFRMIIRGVQRTTHSDSASVSGRARELQAKGFYFLKYNPNGSKPSDVWDILPEDTQNRLTHFAPYPEDLCRIPIKATCPQNGVVLDPFCGTGTTMTVAFELQRKSIGIDVSSEYLRIAEERCHRLL